MISRSIQRQSPFLMYLLRRLYIVPRHSCTIVRFRASSSSGVKTGAAGFSCGAWMGAGSSTVRTEMSSSMMRLLSFVEGGVSVSPLRLSISRAFLTRVAATPCSFWNCLALVSRVYFWPRAR
ncbi:MAG: hypothetical protein BWY66_02899 [bacterium ADurb.Bin374]|nr:MAG: hypothetical protein BWY66_02899 [bacterium ADurb.Bin374]